MPDGSWEEGRDLGMWSWAEHLTVAARSIPIPEEEGGLDTTPQGVGMQRAMQVHGHLRPQRPIAEF